MGRYDKDRYSADYHEREAEQARDDRGEPRYGPSVPEELWERWHSIRMGGHSLTGKMRENKDTLARLVAEEVAKEREACAKLCEDEIDDVPDNLIDPDALEAIQAERNMGKWLAAAIRSRSTATYLLDPRDGQPWTKGNVEALDAAMGWPKLDDSGSSAPPAPAKSETAEERARKIVHPLLQSGTVDLADMRILQGAVVCEIRSAESAARAEERRRTIEECAAIVLKERVQHFMDPKPLAIRIQEDIRALLTPPPCAERKD